MSTERAGRRLSQKYRKEVMRAWVDKSGKNGQGVTKRYFIQGKSKAVVSPKSSVGNGVFSCSKIVRRWGCQS